MTTVLVTGATGNQGGAAVDHLLASEADFEVLGLTRDASGETAESLADRGVRMVEGDLNDPDSIRPHVAEEGVEQFVFSGVGSHHEETGVPHFDSAWEIEQHASGLDLPMAVLQPVFFFQNLEAFAEDILEGSLALPLAEGVPLQMVDVDDVGHAAAVAFEEPDAFLGGRVALAGDELTLAETAGVLSSVTGVDVDPVHVPIEDAYESFGEEFTVMCEWSNEVGYSADIDENEETFGFEFTALPEYLETHGWADKDGMASVPGRVKAL